MFWVGEATWYSTFDAEKALDLVLRSYVVLVRSFSNQWGLKYQFFEHSARLIPRLCAFVGGRVPALTCERLLGALSESHSFAQTDSIEKVRNMVHDLCKIKEAEREYRHFCKARLSLVKDDFLVTGREVLSCWRDLTGLLFTDFNVYREHGGCDEFILSMFHELAKYLCKIYTKEKKYYCAEWFCSFLMKSAKRENQFFLQAKSQAYYVDYLKCTGRLSEAFTQANLLQIFLTDEFGEDYLDWLEEAPNAVKLCQELEALTTGKDRPALTQ